MKKSMREAYDELLLREEKWDYYGVTYLNRYNRIEQLLDQREAHDFIKRVFLQGGKSRATEIVNNEGLQISPRRAIHTVSAFMFGILLRDQLHINMRGLPRIHNNINRNFLYFWSLICLYHDYATKLEEESRVNKNKLFDLESCLRTFNIEYSLFDVSQDGELFKNYYNYRKEQDEVVDHGIAGALLVYDGLMKEYYNAKSINRIRTKRSFSSEGLRFSKDFQKHVLLIANTIARHNLWRATEAKIELYKRYHLEALIPNYDNRSHMVSMNGKHDEAVKDKLLFLLGMVDSIEPIKCMTDNEDMCSRDTVILILERMKIEFDYHNKKFKITCSEEDFFRYRERVHNVDDWLDVLIQINNAEHSIEFSF